jgi:PAS domain S-box-containing protein
MADSPFQTFPSVTLPAEQSNLWNLLPSAVQAAIIATDLSGTVIYWNPFAEKMYGWTPPEVLGRNIMEITVTSETEEEAKKHMEAVQAGNSWAGQFQVLCKDGKYLDAFVTLSLIRNDAGQNTGIVGVSQDLRALRETESALRRSEEQFHAFANSLPELCWIAHGDGHVFWYNDRWYEYTGTAPQEMEGWGWQSVHDPEVLPSVLERWQVSIQTGTPFEMQFPLRGADGIYRWFLTRARPVRDDDGNIVRWYGTITNVDEQRHLVESLSEARDYLEKRIQERTAELKEANADLRELSARLLRSRDDEQRRLARELHDSVGQLIAAQDVSREIRTLSHLLHPPLLDEAGLGSALRWYVEGFAERSGIKVEVEIPTGFSRLPTDTEIAIFRIVQECLTNIHRHSESSTASVSVRPLGNRLLIQIQDQGKGMSRQKQQNLISQGRAGVGVAGMRERLRELGGTLKIQSDERGTVVTGILPLGPAETGPSPEA